MMLYVREGPEPHEHERRKRDEPRRFDPEKRDDEPGETGDDQPQLHVRETPGSGGSLPTRRARTASSHP